MIIFICYSVFCSLSLVGSNAGDTKSTFNSGKLVHALSKTFLAWIQILQSLTSGAVSRMCLCVSSLLPPRSNE